MSDNTDGFVEGDAGHRIFPDLLTKIECKGLSHLPSGPVLTEGGKGKLVMTYNKMRAFSSAVAITLGGLCIVASPASGKSGPIVVTAPDENVVVRHISYADLNLASATGERALNQRVGGAVNDLCLDVTGGNDGSFNFKTTMMKCDDRAWDEARPQIASAVQRAHDIASTGASPTAAVAITISFAQ